MSEQTPNLKLTGKDLINIGIFSAIYFVLSFIGMFLIIPVLWIIMPGIIAILAGIPFMLLCAKVQKPGVPLLMGLIPVCSTMLPDNLQWLSLQHL